MTRSFGGTIAAIALLGVSANAQEGAEDAARLEVSQTEELGEYLTDDEGMSLYLFEADSDMTSACYDACADAWPPLLTDSEPEAGEGVEASLISTFERTDGTTQVAYDGWPLYYYVRDENPGDTTGQDVEGFGAEWYLVSPEGGKVEAHD